MTTQGIEPWEPRTITDRVSVGLYQAFLARWRGVVILLATLLLVGQFAVLVLLFGQAPFLSVLAAVSVVPALAIFWYIRRIDGHREPWGTLAVTFLLGALLASFASAVNTIAGRVFAIIPIVGIILFYFLVVGPGEELVKWLAIRLHAYDRPEFDAVIDGAVYGAAAGLGFATIENIAYIGQNAALALETGMPVISASIPTTFARSLAGPGHVLYSAIAGYYLGLAKFTGENSGPLVVKGLLIAALLHATYNSMLTVIPLAAALGFIPQGVFLVATFLFIPVWLLGLFVFVVRKLRRHNRRIAAAEEARSAPQ
jgi:RsiW-degrading membrane proteinase PrsW (M82 family)